MPQPGLDRDQRAAGAQQPRGLLEARRERALERDVMEHEAVEHGVERAVGELETAGIADVGLVGAAALEHARDAVGIGVDGGQPELRRREQMASRVPAGADRERLAVVEPEPPGEQQLLAAHHLAVVQVRASTARLRRSSRLSAR